MNKLPVLFNDEYECCGCSACYAICPKQAIIMTKNLEGFLYPVVQADLCVCCYSCLSVCPLKSDL